MPASATSPARCSGRTPGWMVVFGSYSRMFWAFPPFGPRGGYFAAADPGHLERRIRAAETGYLRTGRP